MIAVVSIPEQIPINVTTFRKIEVQRSTFILQVLGCIEDDWCFFWELQNIKSIYFPASPDGYLKNKLVLIKHKKSLKCELHINLEFAEPSNAAELYALGVGNVQFFRNLFDAHNFITKKDSTKEPVT